MHTGSLSLTESQSCTVKNSTRKSFIVHRVVKAWNEELCVCMYVCVTEVTW